jgi:hypothetical protein
LVVYWSIINSQLHPKRFKINFKIIFSFSLGNQEKRWQAALCARVLPKADRRPHPPRRPLHAHSRDILLDQGSQISQI